MNKYKHDLILPNQGSLKTKTEQVSEMFDTISHRYDLLNKILSFNLDKKWRQKAINTLLSNKPTKILDIACGTADMSILAAKKSKQLEIIGVDISEKMVSIGKQKVINQYLSNNIKLIIADTLNLPFADNSFDGAMVAFGIRNFENLDKGLLEIKRVLKPGGRLIILEFSYPTKILNKFIVSIYLSIFAPCIAYLFSDNFKAYNYLNKSIKKFPQGHELANIITQLNFQSVKFEKLNFEICTIYEVKK